MYDIKKIIPPSDYQHRDGFTNQAIIDKLSNNEKVRLEDELIKMLVDDKDKGVDTLITETLAYLKSEKAVPIMMKATNWCVYEMSKLSIFTSIFEINGDKNMIHLALDSFQKLDSKKDGYHQFTLIDSFHYLSKFHKSETDNIIKQYIDNAEYLVSYNAKRSLGMISD